MYTSFFTVFLKNRNISSKIKRSKVTDYAALRIENKNVNNTITKYIILPWKHALNSP